MGRLRFESDDGPLVARAAQGDGHAWGAIVARYGSYVQAILRSTRLSEEDVADAFQYVFIELYKSLSTLSNPQYLAPWLRQTALRHAVRQREKLSRSTPMSGELVFELQESDTDIARDLEQAEQAQAVREVVGTLQQRCRELVAALFFEDPPRPYAEVASALGLKIGSLGMTRQRCLEALERALRARGIGA